MNILVCVKQVPDTTEIRIDPETNVLIRDGVPSIVNTYDGYALEAAARIRDRRPDTKIVAVSMGPEQAKNALRDCLATAADKAYLVSDRMFGGSDTLATSYILSSAIRRIEEIEGKFDAVFCGKQAIDGDTAQVGPEIAEHLGYPQVTYALEAAEDGDRLKIWREVEDGVTAIGVSLPCLVTFTKPSFDPRYPTIKCKLASKHAEIPTLTFSDLPNIDPNRVGLRGSPTHVKRSFVPERKKRGIRIREETAEQSAAKLAGLLSDARVI